MPLNLYSTITLLKATEQIIPVRTFLKDTFFGEGKTLLTEDVLIESRKGNRKVAPFVAPRVGGVTMDRQGYKTSMIKAPRIAPQRVLDIVDLEGKGFGESIVSTKSPAQRQAEIIGDDIKDLTDMITRREELMVRDLLFTGKVVVRGYVDDGEKNYVEEEINYNNTTPIVPAKKWGTADADILEDLRKWRLDVIKKTGVAPTMVIVASDVASVIINDAKLQKLLDIKHLYVGEMAPTVKNESITFLGKLPAVGLELYSYDEWYQDDETKKDVPMVPSGHVLLANKNTGKIHYALVTQLENANGSPVFRSYEGKRVPKVMAEYFNDRMMIKLTSRPVPVPDNLDSWVVANVL